MVEVEVAMVVAVQRVAVVQSVGVVKHAKAIAMCCWYQQMARKGAVVVVRTGREADCVLGCMGG